MEGEQLYRLYCQQLRHTGHGYNVVSVTQSQGMPGPEPVDYRALPPRAKAFWQLLAQQFLQSQPAPRPRYGRVM